MSILRGISHALEQVPTSAYVLLTLMAWASIPEGSLHAALLGAAEGVQKAHAEQAARDAARQAARRAGGGGTGMITRRVPPPPLSPGPGQQQRQSSPSSLLGTALWLGCAFVLVDHVAELDLVWRVFGVDVLPRTALQRRLREERCRYRSEGPRRVREAFFAVERERLGAGGGGVGCVEEEGVGEMMSIAAGGKGEGETEGAVTTTSAVEKTVGGRLLDPRNVRVFFVSGEEGAVPGKVVLAFNVNSYAEGVMERVDTMTRWILADKVEPRLAEGRLEMPCKIERVFRDRSEVEYTLEDPQEEDGSWALVDAWERVGRSSVVEDDEARSAV